LVHSFLVPCCRSAYVSKCKCYCLICFSVTSVTPVTLVMLGGWVMMRVTFEYAWWRLVTVDDAWWHLMTPDAWWRLMTLVIAFFPVHPLSSDPHAVSDVASRMCTTDYNFLSLRLQNTRRVAPSAASVWWFTIYTFFSFFLHRFFNITLEAILLLEASDVSFHTTVVQICSLWFTRNLLIMFFVHLLNVMVISLFSYN